MLSFFKKISVAGAFAVSMMFATSAIAFPISPGDTVDINGHQAYQHDVELVAGSYTFEYNFFSGVLPQPASAVNLHLNFGGTIPSSNVFWKDTGTPDVLGASFIDLGGGAYILTLNTLFDIGHAAQTLVVDFTSVGTNNLQYSLTVAAVPVPPALLLFGSSILGIGLLSRRRRRKTSLTAA